jgi:hypothetical protein
MTATASKTGATSTPSNVSPEEARTLRDEATEGPWRWSNTDDTYLQGARTRIVMAFRRMGMTGAQPLFRREPRVTGRLEDGGRANLNDFPDARLIKAAPDLAHTVATEQRRIAEAVSAATPELHDLVRRLIELHAHVRMDTPEDRALHAQAIEAFQGNARRLGVVL